MHPILAAATPFPCRNDPLLLPRTHQIFHENSTLFCYEFSKLVELLSNTVFLLNFHFFEGRKENLHQFTQGGSRGPKALKTLVNNKLAYNSRAVQTICGICAIVHDRRKASEIHLSPTNQARASSFEKTAGKKLPREQL